MRAWLIGAFACALALAGPKAAAQETALPDSGIAVSLVRLEVSGADVAAGEVLFWMPARYLRTGRLASDVHTNRRPWAHPNDIPAGTPVFAQAFDRLGTLWCAVAEWDGNSRSVCFVTVGRDSGQAYIGEPYTAPALAPDFFLQAPAQVIEDPMAAFPPMEMVYTLDRWGRRDLRIWRGLRVNGVVYRIARLTLPRSEDGSAEIRLNGRRIRMTQIGEDGARAELLAPG